jgi:thymidylate synthase
MLKHYIKKNYQDTHLEYQYIDLIKQIINEGTEEIGRNGKVLQTFGCATYWDLTDGTIPLLTTKKLAWKTCLKELLWFISGSTDNKFLQEQNVHIWNGNSSREFLDSRGLNNYEEGILGPIYGYQWRNFNAEYDETNGTPKKSGIDQLQYIIEQLSNPNTRNSRRLILTAWNPCQIDLMALPPCHILCQFNVEQSNKLSCCLYQRSCDVALGQPFNIASYAFLTHLIAHHCGLEPYEFIHFTGNTHIYEQHINPLKEQIQRQPYPFAKLIIKNKYSNINDYKLEDFEILNYESHNQIKMEMVV